MGFDLNVWTMLWTNGKPYVYSTRPAAQAHVPESRFYKREDVIKFERMVARCMPDAKFRCLSNVEIGNGVERVPLVTDMVGWWPKMELFRPDLPTGRNVYFDLDTLIVGDVREIIEYPANFAAIKPGHGVGSDQPHRWKDQEGFWRVPRYQTSVMVWNSGYGYTFWNSFRPVHREYLASDQDFLGEVFPNEQRMPTEWFSKIKKVKNGPLPPIKVVLSMPYNNDEAAQRFHWVKAIWR